MVAKKGEESEKEGLEWKRKLMEGRTQKQT
jgi:hypothetical protein